MTTKKANSKEYNYSLQNIDSYNNILNENNNDIFNAYCGLMIEFLNLISEKVSLKKKDTTDFIIMRGINTITNVFNDLLFYTKNLQLTSNHVEKACYYYTEFVEQITEDQHAFLQLTSRDASMYVYKKTILDINNEIKKKINFSLDDPKNAVFKTLLEFTKIIRILIQKIISNDLKNLKNTNIIGLLNKITKMNINDTIIKEINNVLNILNTNININENDVYIEKLSEFLDVVSNSNKLKKYYEKLNNDFINI